tara:strand:+ start:105845 stop:106861 length:1017 start_codon:yes stop_codon:yes gene_type:complete
MIGKTIIGKAPTRIDLAGGTLDIWPLNLMFSSPVTVNLAIDIMAKVKIQTRKDKKIVIQSVDQKELVKFNSAKSMHHKHKLSLLSRIVEHFLEGTNSRGLKIITDSEAPAGAGIAGSSALNIAMCHAMANITNVHLSKSYLINIAKDIEAALLGIPTGLQDYGAAVYGSGASYTFPPGGMKRKRIPAKAVNWLSSNLLLFYSGTPRLSGVNNWDLFKNIIEKDKKTICCFKEIAKHSFLASETLMAGNYSAFTKAVNDEWTVRHELFKNISTKKIDHAMKKAFSLGALAARICGAGGGGCFILIAPPQIQSDLIKAVANVGCKHLSFNPAQHGVHSYN